MMNNFTWLIGSTACHVNQVTHNCLISMKTSLILKSFHYLLQSTALKSFHILVLTIPYRTISRQAHITIPYSACRPNHYSLDSVLYSSSLLPSMAYRVGEVVFRNSNCSNKPSLVVVTSLHLPSQLAYVSCSS